MKYSMTTLAVAAALALALPAQAATITGSAVSTSTTVGGDAIVTLTLDVSAPVELMSLDFNLTWSDADLTLNLADSSALGLSWAALTGSFDAGVTLYNPGPDAMAVGAGVYGVSTILPGTVLPQGSHTVQLSFTGLTQGPHLVTYALNLGDLEGVDYEVAGNVAVNVSAVPEANPAMMLAAGLAVMGLLARRRRA